MKNKIDLAIVLITFNEAHNLVNLLPFLSSWVNEVFVLDSYSSDETIDVCLENNVKVFQRNFRGFGDQWNFAVNKLPIKSGWTMKLDPDEVISEQLRSSIEFAVTENHDHSYSIKRQLFFMGKPLFVRHEILRLWKTGTCHFPNVLVNEYPIVNNDVKVLDGILEHHDSPCLHHWINKQNNYSSKEAVIRLGNLNYAVKPKLFFSTALQKRLWLKKIFYSIPLRFHLLFIYNWLILGSFKSGRVGYIWACLRSDVMRFVEYKFYEQKLKGVSNYKPPEVVKFQDKRVKQY